MEIPQRAAGDLYGLQNHTINAATVPLADGVMRYIILSLHVAPIGDTDGPLRALPAVCMPVEQAERIARDMLKAAKALRAT